MNRILIIDPGKGWGQFVSKMYCFQKLAEYQNSKIIFLTKRSTQAEYYLRDTTFCDEVIYLNEPRKGIKNIINNIQSLLENINKINKFNFKACYVFHPSLRYLFIAKFSNIREIWGLGFKFQNFFLGKNKKLYLSFFAKTKGDNEALEFVKKITNASKIDYKPLSSIENSLRDTVGIIIAASGNEKRWSIKNYLKVIKFLKEKNYKKFLIISGLDQSKEEELINENFRDIIDTTFTADKKINDVIPYLKRCKFCIGNDTGFSHLSVNLDIETMVIQGDCPPQTYSKLLKHIDIEPDVTRSSKSIHTIKAEKVLDELSNFLNRRGGRVVEGARLESV
ncbi:glycosyltransferase family 9 protein [Pelagibacterales bacterium SAG-MED48]|nr:glycosyltransferase family 9 protein [Pelagibacterales bacterium SAG-MED48]